MVHLGHKISHLPMPIDLDRRNNWPAMQVCYAPPLPLVGCLSHFLVRELCITVHNCAYPVGWNLQCRVLLVCRLVSGAPQLSNRASVSSTSLHYTQAISLLLLQSFPNNAKAQFLEGPTSRTRVLQKARTELSTETCLDSIYRHLLLLERVWISVARGLGHGCTR